MSLNRFITVLFLLAVCLSAFGQLQPGSPWPRGQRNNQNTGLGGASGSNGVVAWSQLFNNGPRADSFQGSPIVGADGTVYSASLNGNVYAIDKTGSLLWTYPGSDPFYGAPAIDTNGILYVESYGGLLYAIDSTDGSGLWSWNSFDPALGDTGDSFEGSPVIDSNGIIYLAGAFGGVYAIDPSTETQVWANTTVGDNFNDSVALSTDGTRVYVAGEDSGVYALNSSDGSVQWSFFGPSNETFYGSPAVDSSGNIYVAGDTGTLYCLPSTGGPPTWTYSGLAGDNFDHTPAIGPDGTIYVSGEQIVSAGSSVLYAVHPNGTTNWTYTGPAGSTYDCSVTVASDGTAYIPSRTGAGLDAVSSTGAFVWRSSVTDFFSGSPAIGADGTVYLQGLNGNLFAIGTHPKITSLTISPSPVVATIGSVGTVTLSSNAPAGGWVVNLQSNSTYVTVPSSVTVSAGSNTATFTISTTQAASNVLCTITGTDSVTSQSGTLTVWPNYVMGLALSPNSIGGGDTSTGTVTIYQPALAGGYVVNLSTQFPSSVGVPSSVTVPEGATKASFTITAGQFNNNFTCAVSASDANSGAYATLTVNGDSIAAVGGLTLNPSEVLGGQGSTGTITLSSKAPTAGWVVHLSSEYPGSVGVPATVTVAAGSTTATFPITTKLFTNTFACDIYASDGHTATQARLTVDGDCLSSVSVNPVVGGSSTSGTVTLASPAPAGGWIVNLSTEYPSVLGVPATVTVLAGQTSVSFTMTTKGTATDYSAGVYAKDATSGKNTTVSVSHA